MRDVQLRDFLEVVDCGGIRAAARRSGFSQASISRNLAALESDYGVPLLERSASGARLTESGKVLLQHARLASLELEKARDEITGIARGRSRTVNVSMTASGEAVLLPRVVGRIHQQFPDAILNLMQSSPAHAAAGLRDGSLDLAVFPSAGAFDQGFTCQRLFSADVIVAARVGHPLADSTTIAQLAAASWISGASRGREEPVLPAMFRQAGLPSPHYVVSRESFSALLSLLLRTDLLATVTRCSVEPLLDTGALVAVPLKEKLPAVVFNMYAREGQVHSKLVEAVAAEFRKASRAHRR